MNLFINKYISLVLLLSTIFFYNNILSVDQSDVFPELVYWTAIKKSNLEKVESFLSEGYSSNNKDDKEMTPISYAVKLNNLEMIDLLLSYDADIDGVFKDKMTPLIFAVSLNKKEMVDLLLFKGADLDKQDLLGRTALMLAIEKEFFEIAKTLIKHNMDHSLTDYSGKSISDYTENLRNLKLKKLIADFINSKN